MEDLRSALFSVKNRTPRLPQKTPIFNKLREARLSGLTAVKSDIVTCSGLNNPPSPPLLKGGWGDFRVTS